jgi:hypothetical protein
VNTKEYLAELNTHLSQLYAFARRMNELDFAVSLSGEFRGMQDAGWNTTITANEVFDELTALTKDKRPHSKAEIRVILMLYCQLAEAGGVYESLKNIMGVVKLKPYLLWPFKNLVRVKKTPHKVVGPNANATFRDLAQTAAEIGLWRLSSLLEDTFRDDVRNAVYHADYVIWEDGLRLCKRNGGFGARLPFDELGEVVTRAAAFYDILRDYNGISVRSFNPAKEIVGRFSENFPMPWTVSFDPDTGAFRISGSSPGPVVTPEYQRQSEISGRLGGKVMAVYTHNPAKFADKLEQHVLAAGFEPNAVVMDQPQFMALINDIEKLGLWDERKPRSATGDILLATPWGFRWLNSQEDFDDVLVNPLLAFDFT